MLQGVPAQCLRCYLLFIVGALSLVSLALGDTFDGYTGHIADASEHAPIGIADGTSTARV